MPKVKFTSALKRFYPELNDLDLEGENLKELIEKIEVRFPGIKNYLLDDQGIFRKHVNVFIDGSLINDKNNLLGKIKNQSEILIMQALSGG